MAVLESRTYLPSDQGALDRVEAVLAGEGGSEFALVGPAGNVPVPPEVHDVLVQVIEAMRAGRAITVTPQTRKLTTQQGADLVGVSRPTFVKLIESGEIPFERVSSRRTVLLQDVVAYRQRRRDEQLAAITSTSMDDDLDADELKELLKQARRAKG